MSTNHRDACQSTRMPPHRIAPLAQVTCLILLVLPLFACSRNQELSADVLHSFELAFTRDDIDACMALFADDAQILPEHGEIIASRDGIKAYLQSQMTPVVSFNTMADMSLVRSDIAVEQGRFKFRDTRIGADIEWGKYIHIWKKVKGDWKLYRVIYNTDVAPAGEVSVESTDVPKSSS
jgi:ketosteroid isomerase-like protein